MQAELPTPSGYETTVPETLQVHAQGIPIEGLERIQHARTGESSVQFHSSFNPHELLALRELGFAPRGVAVGSALFHLDIAYGGYFQNQELTHVTRAMHLARARALERLIGEAKRMDADGVLDIRLQITTLPWAEHTIECTAHGNAVVSVTPSPNAPAGEDPFSTALPLSEIAALTSMNLRPWKLVFGSCVYHAAYQAFDQSVRETTIHSEISRYSQALAGARESALARLEKHAAGTGATGVVGVNMSEHRHGWRDHVTEFFAIGNAVKAA